MLGRALCRSDRCVLQRRRVGILVDAGCPGASGGAGEQVDVVAPLLDGPDAWKLSDGVVLNLADELGHELLGGGDEGSVEEGLDCDRWRRQADVALSVDEQLDG